MKKFLISKKSVWYLPEGSDVDTYISDEMPPLELCVSVYAFVFKDGEFFMSDLREGERPTRRLDIPGGHIDEGESPEEAIVREVFEETGVVVKVSKLVAFNEVKINIPKPEGYRYPYPVSYMLHYLCEVAEEKPFEGNEDTHGRVWLKPEDFKNNDWCERNKVLLDEIIKNHS